MSIKKIDIIMTSHTDLGYTDHPEIALDLHKQYIDEALIAIEDTAGRKAGERFTWTCESLHIINEWWLEADDVKRKRLLQAINNGSMEVTGYPFNNTALYNDDGWDKMFDWIPKELWEKMNIRTGIQNDVGSVPVASAVRAAGKGINYLFVGLNGYNGDLQFDIPSAFRWNLPGGKSILVWLNPGYWTAHDFFNENWRVVGVSGSDDLRFRRPERGDFFKADEESVLKAHSKCLELLKEIEGNDSSDINPGIFNNKIHWGKPYKYERLITSLTNHWRGDNDPPFPPIADFVAKWNSMGLEPELRLTIPFSAFSLLEKEIGNEVPEYSGEWTDWWIHGAASSPVQLSASRKAKRLIKELKGSFFNPLSQKNQKKIDTSLRDLCHFDEHTWGYSQSVFSPYSANTVMQEAEKSIKAFRPLVWANYIQAEIVGEKMQDKGDGIFVTNISGHPGSQWIELPVKSLRGQYTHIRNTSSGIEEKLILKPGIEFEELPESVENFSLENVSHTVGDLFPDKKVAFWSGTILPGYTVKFELINREGINAQPDIKEAGSLTNSSLQYETDKFGWPSSAIWEGMSKALFSKGFADFHTCKPLGFLPRTVLKNMFFISDPVDRMKANEENISKIKAEYEKKAIFEDTNHTLIFKQEFGHEALVWGIRTLEIWKDQPRVRLKVKINRKPSMNPEIFYINFPLTCKMVIPTVSNGGYPFEPGKGQLPGCYMDYLAIDG